MTTDNLDPNVTQPKKRTRSRRAKVTIQYNKYKTLIDSLEDRHKVRRIIFTIYAIGMLLFIGITFITLSIKRLYPYSDITTNGLGASTIKSEKNEVSYWLFNTATVWANSGIHVDKGDIIIVRASGKSHTAIHHLYDAALNNFKISGNKDDAYHEWVGCEGLPPEKETGRGKERRKYRIFPDMPSGALLMQVSKGKPYDTPEDTGANPDNFYFIGKERQHVYINEEGDLYFAVNDIVLNRPTIAKMMWECIREKYNDGDSITKNKIDSLKNNHPIIVSPNVNYKYSLQLNVSKKKGNTKKGNIEDDKKLCNEIKNLFDEVFEPEFHKANQMDLLLNPSRCTSVESFLSTTNTMCSIIQKECKCDTSLKKRIIEQCTIDPSFIDSVCSRKVFQIETSDSIEKLFKTRVIYETLCKIKKVNLIPEIGKMKFSYTHKPDTLICELSYYYCDSLGDDKNEKRKTVWFDDNIGSFLIVIEKTK